MGDVMFSGCINFTFNHRSSKRLNLTIGLLNLPFPVEFELWQLINFFLCCSFLFISLECYEIKILVNNTKMEQKY